MSDNNQNNNNNQQNQQKQKGQGGGGQRDGVSVNMSFDNPSLNENGNIGKKLVDVAATAIGAGVAVVGTHLGSKAVRWVISKFGGKDPYAPTNHGGATGFSTGENLWKYQNEIANDPNLQKQIGIFVKKVGIPIDAPAQVVEAEVVKEQPAKTEEPKAEQITAAPAKQANNGSGKNQKK